jgi:hypothetical protein
MAPEASLMTVRVVQIIPVPALLLPGAADAHGVRRPVKSRGEVARRWDALSMVSCTVS